MSDFPADILKAAEAVIRGDDRQFHHGSNLHRAIAGGISDERERCYRLCIDEAGRHAAYKSGHDEAEAARACAKRIKSGEWARFGDYDIAIKVDNSIPAGELHAVDQSGKTVGKIVNVPEAVTEMQRCIAIINSYSEEHGKKTEWDREGEFLEAVCARIIKLLRGEQQPYGTPAPHGNAR